MPDAPPPPTPEWEHYKVDRLRAVGLRTAVGDVIAMLQDNALPGPDWCANIWQQHRLTMHHAIGGAIEYPGANLLTRAVYYCDFSRYQPPFAATQTEFASVLNVAYKRAAIEASRDEWSTFFDESVVHRRIRQAGGTIFLVPDVAVTYTPGPQSAQLALRRKFASGRAFAGRRARRAGFWRRAVLTTLS